MKNKNVKKNIFRLGIIFLLFAYVATVKKVERRKIRYWEELAEKHLVIMKLFDLWMQKRQAGKSVKEYLDRNNIKSVAIYGMSYVGERLYSELKHTDIEIKYFIDKNAANIYAERDIKTPDDDLGEVDAIIVTAVYYFEEIEQQLRKKTAAEIISIEDILHEI